MSLQHRDGVVGTVKSEPQSGEVGPSEKGKVFQVQDSQAVFRPTPFFEFEQEPNHFVDDRQRCVKSIGAGSLLTTLH